LWGCDNALVVQPYNWDHEAARLRREESERPRRRAPEEIRTFAIIYTLLGLVWVFVAFTAARHHVSWWPQDILTALLWVAAGVIWTIRYRRSKGSDPRDLRP
jgi:hypothetical protein